jgi:hypothetical protein
MMGRRFGVAGGELGFSITYDIKYRMGKEAEKEE